MRRRQFCQRSLMLAGSATLVGGDLIFPGVSAAADDFADVKISRIVGFDLLTRRDKLVGRNSRLDVHGDRSMDRMIRIETTAGVTGLGPSRSSKEDVAKLLGKSPLSYFRRDDRQMVSPLGRRTTALWDLAGKLLKKPVYELLRAPGFNGPNFKGMVPGTVRVYDGSIYFIDLLPQFAARWQDRVKREIDMAREAGHSAAKVKIGRGNKWMERAAGDDRDVEVLQLIRAHGGDDFVIGVDANNGYDPAGAKRFLSRAGELKLAFAEEMFPETVEACLEFKKFMADHGWQTLLADGESQRTPEAFQPFVDAGAIDVLQGDMKHFGFEKIMEEAALRPKRSATAGGHSGSQFAPPLPLIAPHNWGSLLGYYMQLQVGRAIDRFYMAEHDPLKTDVLVADGYGRKDGLATVPDVPGMGLSLDAEKFAAEAKINFELQA